MEAEVLAQFATNVFSQLTLLRHILPSMRSHRSDTIAILSSIGAYSPTPNCTLYCATKSCLSTLSLGLSREVSSLGIKVISIEPGYFRTKFLAGGHRVQAEKKIGDYDGEARLRFDEVDGKQKGDVEKGAAVIVEVLTGTGRAEGKKMPRRLVLGSDCVQAVERSLEEQRRELEEWREVILSTDHGNVY
jgi:short-subunit dehydrogenase